MVDHASARSLRLIAEYEVLRKLANELDVHAEMVDERLIEIERELPEEYVYPGNTATSGRVFRRSKSR